MLEVAQRTAVGKQGFLRVGQHVDEAGRDGQALGVDLGLALAVARGADVGDAVALDGHLAGVGLAAEAVVHDAVTDHQIIGRRCGGSGGGRHEGDGATELTCLRFQVESLAS